MAAGHASRLGDLPSPGDKTGATAVRPLLILIHNRALRGLENTTPSLFSPSKLKVRIRSASGHLEHLECSQQPHAQDRGAKKRAQLAGRLGSGYGLESPSPGGARSQGHNTGLRGLAPCTGFPLNCRTPPLYSELKNTLRGIVPRSGFPLAAERPLYSELVDTTLASDTRIRTAPAQLLDDNTRMRSCETPIKKQRGKSSAAMINRKLS